MEVSPASDFETRKHQKMNRTTTDEYKSRTVLVLFNILLPDKINSLQFVMIAIIINGLLNRIPTPLQVFIVVMIRGKKLIRHLIRYRVVHL